ncbi:MAG: ABC transporter ATP-binding protein [Methanobacteriaceae archaeon]|jgi:putative ABC transport system ATP-binding protein|nr:ABC transporter ATP-binding protein [Methanobacteriaceae archaeon]OPY24575.1 MAG: putative ABC transporter ATP-binding protein [Methanobacterium sp. PtaU1.Bin097]
MSDGNIEVRNGNMIEIKENIIEIKDLTKSFDGGNITALDGINLEIKEGEFVSIMGPSGSGKSTLLNMIGALDKADSGQIKVAGIDLMQSEDFSKFRLNKIGFVFQLHNLIPNLTVHENVQIPLIETDVTDEEMIERAAELLNSVNLGNRLDQLPTKLSGGERQRVAIARALVNHPSIILADEPTGALDSRMGDIILNLLREIHQKENVTLVLVTHEDYVANSADRVINMMDGKIVDSNIA